MNTKSQIERIRKYYDDESSKLKMLKFSVAGKRTTISSLMDDLEDSKKAHEVIHVVAQSTQEELKYHLSDLVSSALGGVFPDPYKLVVDFVPKRGQMEVDLNFERHGKLKDPKRTGGGAADIASLALRFSCWAMRRPRSRPVLLLDEPLKWLKGAELPKRGAEIIKEISEELGIQIIMVSHDPELIDSADKVISVYMKNGVSYIR